MNDIVAMIALGIPTLMLLTHAARLALVAATPTPGHADDGNRLPFIDVPEVGIGFAVSLVSVAVGRHIAGHEFLRGIHVANLSTFCLAIAWGFWAHGTRRRWSSRLILLGSASAGCLLGVYATSW